jgi:hypothetical protein
MARGKRAKRNVKGGGLSPQKRALEARRRALEEGNVALEMCAVLLEKSNIALEDAQRAQPAEDAQPAAETSNVQEVCRQLRDIVSMHAGTFERIVDPSEELFMRKRRAQGCRLIHLCAFYFPEFQLPVWTHALLLWNWLHTDCGLSGMEPGLAVLGCVMIACKTYDSISPGVADMLEFYFEHTGSHREAPSLRAAEVGVLGLLKWNITMTEWMQEFQTFFEKLDTQPAPESQLAPDRLHALSQVLCSVV